ncbi:MAG: pitrilysin family protein [Cyanobacteria bacterium P01_A01_bin.37]
MQRQTGMKKRWYQGRYGRWLRFIGLTLVVVGLLTTGIERKPALAQEALHYTELEFPPLPELTIPDYERVQLANGLTVYLMEDHELPLVGGQVLVNTGDRLEPDDKLGLATIVGEGMRLGGSEDFPADGLNEFLEQRAASIETGIGLTSGNVRFSTLTDDFPSVFERFASVARYPAFPQDKITLLKRQIAGGIARRNDDPGSIARREFNKLIYGSDSPYARTTEYSTIANVTRDDVLAFHQQYFHPSNMLLSVYGDFDSAEMRSLIEQTFGAWPDTGAPLPKSALPTLPTVTQQTLGGVFLVNQPQLTQSSILFGHLGGQRDNPDYAALTVMNQVLNGLGGRLLNEVRSRQGLAYSVYAFWSAPYDYPGVFIAGGETRSETTVPFVEATIAEIKAIQHEAITEEELTQAKDSVLNSFVFNFQSPSQILSRVVTYDFYDYPEDFIFQYRQAVESTTVEDIQRVAAEYLTPENLVILVVGNGEAIAPPLSTLTYGDDVTPLDISIPEPDIESGLS